MKSDGSARRNHIDWLRVGATFLLFIFHVAMVFNPAPFFHIRNSDISFFFLILCGFISLWHMPLFFFLAGWSIFSSLSSRGVGRFLRERCLRLGVPLIAGCILLIPPIKYLELRSGMDANHTGLYIAEELQGSFVQVIPSGLPVMESFNESFLEFLPTFFSQSLRFTWAHLWFIAYLFVFTVCLLPIFLVLLRRHKVLENVATFWVYLPILPLALIQVFLRPHYLGLQNLYNDWANVAFFSTFLLAGFLIAQHRGLEEVVNREWRRAFCIGGASVLLLLLAVLEVFSSEPTLLALSAVAGWCFVLGFIGLAHDFLSFRNKLLNYLSESAFPVYILHQSAIVLIGYPLIQSTWSIPVKFFLLVIASLMSTLAIYHYLIRSNSVGRFLCGMRGKERSTDTALAPVPTMAGLVILALLLLPAASEAATPEGLWYAEGGAAKVELATCEERRLCGKIVWLRSPLDEHGCELRDENNPDPGLRDRPVIGIDILWGLERAGAEEETWDRGEIYDPGSGNTYSLRMSMINANQLELRGYLGLPIIGRSTKWFRVGAESETCHFR